MTPPTSPWRRRITAGCAALLLLTGIVAVTFSIVGAYDRAAASSRLAKRVDQALDALCAYQRGGKVESDRRYDFSQVLAVQDAKGWRDAAEARRVSAVEAAGAGHLSAARTYLRTAAEYDLIANAITAAAARINKRPKPPCPS